MFFSSPSTRKMAKDAPNNITENTIGLAQTSREILEDNILIFLVVLSTPDPLWLSLNDHCDRTGIPLSTFCVEVNTFCI